MNRATRQKIMENFELQLRSVLLLAVALQVCQSRRLSEESEDMDNEISIPPAAIPYREPMEEWLKFSALPKAVISKKVGGYVELECEVMGSPPPTIQWLKGKTPLTENDNFQSNFISETPSVGMAKVKARIVINYVLPVHSGRFTCVAESGPNIITADTTLYVIRKEGFTTNFTQLFNSKILGAHHKPRISLWAPTYMDVMGTNAILPCHTFGNPKPTHMWIGPDRRVIGESDDDERISVLPNGDLSIRSLKWNDMGSYTCEVHNMVGKDSAETFIYPMKESK